MKILVLHFLKQSETNESTKELVNKELPMLKRYQMDAKDIKCLLEWWGKHESFFPIIIKLLGIVEYQIETKKVCSLIGILVDWKKCQLQ
jgi:hypothetical protein